MKRSMFILAAAMWLLCGSARAVDFKVGFTGCPGTIERLESEAGTDVAYTLTGTLTTANNDQADGAQGWSYGVAVTNGELAGFSTTIEIPTLFQKVSGGPMTEKALVIDDAGFYSAKLLPLEEGTPKTGFTAGIVFSTSKKQVLEQNGQVETVHLQVRSRMPAKGDPPLVVGVQYKEGLQGSGQPVANVVTLYSESYTPSTEGCDTTLQLEVIPKVFNLALAPRDGEPAPIPDDTAYEKKVKVNAGPVTVPVQVVLSTDNLPTGDVPQPGPQGWSLSIASDNPAGVFSNPDVCGLKVLTIYEKVKGSPDYSYELDLCDVAFNETAVTVDAQGNPDGKGVISAIVPSTSKKLVLHANASDRILYFEYSVPVADQAVQARIFFQDGGQGSGQPVNNVVTYDTASMIPPVLTFQALNLELTVGEGPADFIRGNANGDARVDIADAIFVIYAVVPGLDTDGTYQIECEDAADANADGSVDIADGIYMIDYEFRGGAQPPPPFPACGKLDTTKPEDCPGSAHTGCP